MKIWLVTIGEPLPIDKDNNRLLRAGNLAKYLSQHGHHVVWWTSTFDHVMKRHRFQSNVSLKVAEGYEINLLHSNGYKKNISLARIIDHRQLAKKILIEALKCSRPDVILCSLPPLELCVAAANYGLQMNIPVVLDIRDLWPDVFMDFFPPWTKSMLRILCFPFYQMLSEACCKATAIVGCTDSFVRWALGFAKRNATKYDKAFPFANLDSVRDEVAISKAINVWTNRGIVGGRNLFIVSFLGTISHQFDLDTVIKAAKKIETLRPNFRFVICGAGDRLPYYQKLAKDCSNVILPGWVNKDEAKALLRMSAVGLAPYVQSENFLKNLPNKIIEYFSEGLPILSSLDGVTGELLIRYGCGRIYRAGDSCNLADELIKLYDFPDSRFEMSKKSNQLYREKFDAEKVYGDMEKHLSNIAQAKEVSCHAVS